MRFIFSISVGSLGLMAENGTVVTEFSLPVPLSAELQTGLFFGVSAPLSRHPGGNLGVDGADSE